MRRCGFCGDVIQDDETAYRSEQMLGWRHEECVPEDDDGEEFYLVEGEEG